MTQELVSIEPSPAAKEFIKEQSELCKKFARRVSPTEMAVSLAYVTGWAMGGMPSPERLKPALDDNIRAGQAKAAEMLAQAKIAGAVKRAIGT